MSHLYDALAQTPEGARQLSMARLRREIQVALFEALQESGKSQADLARELGVRKSAVNQVFSSNGNLQIDTIAKYLHALGAEILLIPVPAGVPRLIAETIHMGISPLKKKH